jgi:hypothetical protein
MIRVSPDYELWDNKWPERAETQQGVISDIEEMERRGIAILELREKLREYRKFFENYKNEMRRLLLDEMKVKEMDVFVSWSFDSLESFTCFSNAVAENLSKLNQIYLFLMDPKRQKEMETLLWEIARKPKLVGEMLFTIDRDVNNLRSRMDNLLESIMRLLSSIDTTENIAVRVIRKLESSFMEEYHHPMFGKIKTWNVNYKHKGNLLLTWLYNDIFNKLPNISKKEKIENNEWIQSKKELLDKDLQQIDNKGIRWDIIAWKMLGQLPYDVFQRLMKLYKGLLPIHTSVELGVIEILSRRNPRMQGERFKWNTAKIEELYENLEKYLWTKEPVISAKLDSIYNWSFVESIIKKDSVGDPKLLVLKKKIFNLIDQYFDDKPVMSELLLAKSEYMTYKTSIDTSTKEWWKNTNHYSFEAWEHGLIQWYKPHILNSPAKVIGDTASTVVQKIKDIIERNNGCGNIYASFPGIDNSLEGNVLIMWPYGYGKTALIRQLWADPNILTMQVNYSDIATAYYSHEEKNATAIFEHAQQLWSEKNKDVFILIDEFDKFFNHSAKSAMSDWKNLWVQTAFQIWMDGIDAYDKVHLIGLTNKPQLIPVDITRRLTLLIMDPLTMHQKFDLIQSRLNRFPKSDDLIEFLESMKSPTYNNNGLSSKWTDLKELYNKISEVTVWDIHTLYESIEQSTPKIVTSMTEKSFLLFHKKLLEKKDIVAWVNKKIGKIMNTKKPNDEKIRSVYATTGVKITLEDFAAAIRNVFENKAVIREIEVCHEFYQEAESLISAGQGAYKTK